MKQSINKVFVEGLLSENKLELRTTGDGRNYITGSMDIEVAENNVVPVHFLTFEKKKDGGLNKIFASLSTVMNTYQSIAQAGRENADKVRVTSGELEVNDFYPADGNLVSYTRVKSNFINRLTGGAFNPRAEFEVEVFVKSHAMEIKNDEETGRLKVKAIAFGYNGKAMPMDLVIESEAGVKYIEDNYEPGCTTKLSGRVINTSVTTKKVEEQAFGDPIITEKTTNQRELMITKGTEVYDEDVAFAIGDVKQSMTNREVYLAEQKKKSEERKANQGGGNTNAGGGNGGFGFADGGNAGGNGGFGGNAGGSNGNIPF